MENEINIQRLQEFCENEEYFHLIENDKQYNIYIEENMLLVTLQFLCAYIGIDISQLVIQNYAENKGFVVSIPKDDCQDITGTILRGYYTKYDMPQDY